jgi:hypothetical protein
MGYDIKGLACQTGRCFPSEPGTPSCIYIGYIGCSFSAEVFWLRFLSGGLWPHSLDRSFTIKAAYGIFPVKIDSAFYSF